MLTEVLIALFLAISLDPAVRMLMRWRIQRGVAILVVVLAALGLTAAFLQSVIPALVDQFQAMRRDFPALYGQPPAPFGQLPPDHRPVPSHHPGQ